MEAIVPLVRQAMEVPQTIVFFLSLNLIVLTPLVIKSAGFINVGQNLQVWDDVISCIL